MQGLWVFLCSLPVLILNSKKAGEERCAWPAPTDAAGMLLYVVGLAVEVSAAEQTFGMLFEVGLTRRDSTRLQPLSPLQMTADFQKHAFLNDSRNRGKWINVGLWR